MPLVAADFEQAFALLLQGLAGTSPTAMSALAALEAGVYPSEADPNATDPKIVYRKISGDRDYCLDGPTGLVKARMQVECYGTYASSKQLAEAVNANLSGFAGGVGSVTIQSCFLEGELDIDDPNPGISGNAEKGVQLDFMVWYVE